MCVGVPMQVMAIEGTSIMAEIDGVRREASIMLLDEPVAVGDYVIVHAGFAISKLDAQEAQETLALMRELLSADDMG